MRSASVWLTLHRASERLADGSRVDRRGALVEGVVIYRLDRAAEAGDTLRLLDFAAFLREPPHQLDEVALDQYFDGPFEPGALELLGAWGGTPYRDGPRKDIVVALEPGRRELTLRYRVLVPHRYWPFGCVRDRCSLSGALAPLPSRPARGGRWLPGDGRVIDPVAWTVERAELAVPGRVRPDPIVLPGGRVPEQHPPDEVIVVGGQGERTPYPSVFFGPAWERTHEHVLGLEVEVLHTCPRPSGQVPRESLLQLRRDVVGHALTIAGEVASLMTVAGLPPRPGSRLVVIEGPLRSSVAEAHPGVTMLSDQALELLPLPRILRFHQEAIARAIADTLVEAELRPYHDPSTRLWLASQLGFAVLQWWRRARDHPDEFAADILRNLTFVPAVDRFLYSQQASFSQTYFRGVEDDPPVRNHPAWFSHALPTGRRIHEKLQDTLGAARLESLYRTLFTTPARDPVAAAEEAYGYTLGWFFEQWLGPYPKVDYLIGGIASEPNLQGGYHHRIEIHRRAEVPLIEPVQVLVTDRDDEQHFLVWNGELGHAGVEPRDGVHVLELDTQARLRSVRIDPRQRLHQTPLPPHENVDPVFNDLRPPAFRWIYTGAGLSIAASEFVNASTLADRWNAVAGLIAFEGSLRRDLRTTGSLLIARDRESRISLAFGAGFGLGAKVNRQRRRARVRLSGTIAWLSDRSLDPRGGVRLTQSLSFADDTRRFGWWPERGRRFEVGVTTRQVLRTEPPRDHRFDVLLFGEWTHLWPIVHQHVLATMLYAEIMIPIASEPEFRSLSRVGGIGGLSGYVADEVFGRALASANLEYRHTLLGNLDINLLNLAFLRNIGGVAFTGVASTSGCGDYADWFSRDAWYAQVGYGLTAQLSILGVTPQLFRVEASVPLVRRYGVPCLGREFPDFLAERQGLSDVSRLLPPVNINVLFNQAY